MPREGDDLTGSQRAVGAWSTALDEPHSWQDWARYALVAVAALLCLVLIGIAAAYFRPAH